MPHEYDNHLNNNLRFVRQSIVSYNTDTEQNINHVLSTIRAAKRKEKVTAELLLHSDQGFQYTSPGYFKLTKEYKFTTSIQNAKTLITML